MSRATAGGLETYPTRGIHYWALGGRAEQSTLFNSPGIAHYPGTPQGRSPAEAGRPRLHAGKRR